LLKNDAGGKGILIGGVPAVPSAEVVIIGGGVVGTFATRKPSDSALNHFSILLTHNSEKNYRNRLMNCTISKLN